MRDAEDMPIAQNKSPLIVEQGTVNASGQRWIWTGAMRSVEAKRTHKQAQERTFRVRSAFKNTLLYPSDSEMLCPSFCVLCGAHATSSGACP